jgi:hypothetical protein
MALVIFIGIAPFVCIPLSKLPAFIPAYQAALFFIDLLTAVLLIDQFLRLRSIPLLVLAAGYLRCLHHRPAYFEFSGRVHAEVIAWWRGADHGLALRFVARWISTVRDRLRPVAP